MRVFRRKSKWQQLTAPVANAAGMPAARSGLAALGTMIGVTVASAAVSAVRGRKGSS